MKFINSAHTFWVMTKKKGKKEGKKNNGRKGGGKEEKGGKEGRMDGQTRIQIPSLSKESTQINIYALIYRKNCKLISWQTGKIDHLIK